MWAHCWLSWEAEGSPWSPTASWLCAFSPTCWCFDSPLLCPAGVGELVCPRGIEGKNKGMWTVRQKWNLSRVWPDLTEEVWNPHFVWLQPLLAVEATRTAGLGREMPFGEPNPGVSFLPGGIQSSQMAAIPAMTAHKVCHLSRACLSCPAGFAVRTNKARWGLKDGWYQPQSLQFATLPGPRDKFTGVHLFLGNKHYQQFL